ncbi:hypothetical protein [Lentilactobacillus parabuchneri]|uniref:hypothetical protein n=1 Tax=Lentilactobacillus parabuchneri TaxID=152331 RepID=UPI0015D8D456|nr:hypothetical protein [Lentilactobacillus parabuchneri]
MILYHLAEFWDQNAFVSIFKRVPQTSFIRLIRSSASPQDRAETDDYINAPTTANGVQRLVAERFVAHSKRVPQTSFVRLIRSSVST